MRDNEITSDLLRGHTDTMILKLLSEADRYGYEIVKLIGELGRRILIKRSHNVFQRTAA
jgi:DNA-binding PadR family transcriptional regulator